MQFSDTTNKNGIIQTIERWTGLGDATISGDATLLKQITASVNDAFDEVLPYIYSLTDKPRWDDINHTDLPIGTFNIVSGQQDYSVTADDNSLDILNLTGVRILTSSSGLDYESLEKMTGDDERAETAMSPDSSDMGIPTHYLEVGNVIFLYPKPNYSATNGAKIFFEREPSYFASSDTTKEPGIPKPFHSLLAFIAAHEWLVLYKNDNTTAISRLEKKISDKKEQLDDIISKRNRTRSRISTSYQSGGVQSGRIGTGGSDSNK